MPWLCDSGLLPRVYLYPVTLTTEFGENLSFFLESVVPASASACIHRMEVVSHRNDGVPNILFI